MTKQCCYLKVHQIQKNWNGMTLRFFHLCMNRYLICIVLVTDIPAQVPPLTPGTNKKMTEALKASFASWEKELMRHNIPKGKNLHNFPHDSIPFQLSQQ